MVVSLLRRAFSDDQRSAEAPALLGEDDGPVRVGSFAGARVDAPRLRVYDLRVAAGLSQRELAERMGTTQSVISRLEEGGGVRNRIDTLARVATALGRHLVLSFPVEMPDHLEDAMRVA